MPSPLSIYIHWPFCKSKCPYCDFNSHVRTGIDEKKWRAALLKELAYYARKTPQRQVGSVFFGGGTPSLMPPGTVAALIGAIKNSWGMAGDAEITLEANPTSIESSKFIGFREAGVNRVSIGIQSLLPEGLAFLGREHNAEEALAALALAHSIFPRVSFDLIYARPGQTLAVWEKELREALRHAGSHLSLYQLTIEENTAFHHIHANGGFVLPEEGLSADMYLLTESITAAHGLAAYEISNYARPGEESRHNLAYWKSQDYIGIGPGAHGRYYSSSENTRCRVATENIKSPERWLEKVEREENGLAAKTPISGRESLEEAVMMGLRLTSGIRYEEWNKRLDMDLRTSFAEQSLRKLEAANLIIADDSHIRATLQGRLLLNGITRALLTAA